FTVDPVGVVATTVRAIACKGNYQASVEHTATVGDASAQVTFDVQPGNAGTPNAPATGADPFAMTIANLNPADAIVCYTMDGTNPDCDAAGAACTAGQTYDPAAPPQIMTDPTTFTARACRNGLGKSFIHQFNYNLKAKRPLAA